LAERDEIIIDNPANLSSLGNTDAKGGETLLLTTAAKGTLLNFMGSTAARLMALFLQVLVCRLYGREYYGLFVTGLLICQITQIISALGLQKGGMRFMAMAHERHDYNVMHDIFKTAVFFPLLFGIFMGSVCYGLSPFLAVTCFKDAEMVYVLRSFSFAVPFFALLRVGSDLSRAFKTTKYAVMVDNLLFGLLQVAFFIALIALGYGFLSIVYSFIFAAALSSILMLILAHRQLRVFTGPLPALRNKGRYSYSFFPKNWRPILAYSVPLTPFGLLLVAGSSVDIIMLNILSDSAKVGEYAAAARWVMLFGMITCSLDLIFGPLMAGQFGLNQANKLKLLYRASSRWMFFLTLPAAVSLVLAREPLMMVFGKGFLLHGPAVLGILVLASPFVGVAGSAGILFVISRHQYVELSCLAGNMLLNILLNLLWIPQYGLLGAAVATAVGTIVTASARILLVYRHLKIHPFSAHLLIPALAGLILCLGGLFVEWKFHPCAVAELGLAIGAACLVLLIIIKKGMDVHDRCLLGILGQRFCKAVGFR